MTAMRIMMAMILNEIDRRPMANNAFDGFRQKYATKPAPDLVVNRKSVTKAYEAFGAKDKVTRLDIRCRQGGIAHAVAYNYLLNISYNRKTYNEIFLTISGLTVMIKGRGLKPIVDALKLHICEFIEEFDSDEYAAPSDADAPFIDSISVEVLRGAAPSTSNTAVPG
jgi:hypothetical protein